MDADGSAVSVGRIVWCFAITAAAVLLYLYCAWRSGAPCCAPRRCTSRRRRGSEVVVVEAPEWAPEWAPECTIGESGSCTVCLDEVDLLQSAVRLPCGHVFHSECILPWVSRAATCPNCRALATP